MVRAVDDQTASPRRLSQCAATQSGDSGLHRCASGESEAVRLDQDCRRDSGQHRAIRRAHRRRAGHTTSVTNHRDRTLADTYADDKGRGLKLSELWRAPSSGGPAVVAVMVIQQAVAGVVLIIACANVAT